MSMGGSGALGVLGIMPMPIGTLEELRKHNINPSSVGSCAPSAGLPGHEPGVRGCPVWDRCPFHLKRNGGFKGKGPRYVGYFLQTHEGNKKEDFMRCYDFVATMLGRMRAGQRDREEGKAGEIIEIVAQEGEKISIKRIEPVDERNTALTAPYRFHRDVIPVPAFPRPGESAVLGYDEEITQRHLERHKASLDAEAATPRVDHTKDTEKYKNPAKSAG